MPDRRPSFADVASPLIVAALIALTAPASAQNVLPDPDAERGEIPSGPMEEETEAAEDEDLTTTPEARAEARLDELFAALSDPANAQWEQTEAEIWRRWSRSGSPSMDLLLRRADQAAGEGALNEAIAFLDDLVRLAPDFAEGWNKRATIHFMREDFGRSVADIQRTLALEPRHFGALSGLGIILEQTGDPSGALRAWRRALEVHPNLESATERVEQLAPEVEGREL